MIQASSGGLASQLFSTAVISGSKSLPNLVADCKNSKYCRTPRLPPGPGRVIDMSVQSFDDGFFFPAIRKWSPQAQKDKIFKKSLFFA